MRTVLLLVAMGLGAPPDELRTYAIDAGASDVYVQIAPDRGTLLSGLSHEHVIVARALRGKVEWREDRPDACWVDIEVPVSGLEVDPEPKRRALGFDKPLSDGDRAKVEKNMRAKNQLWADEYALIRFRGTRCERKDASTIEVRGALTVRGVSADVVLPVRVDFEEDGLRARVDFTRVHADFGFEPYSNLLGALKNDDALRFHVDLRATRTSTVSQPSGPE